MYSNLASQRFYTISSTQSFLHSKTTTFSSIINIHQFIQPITLLSRSISYYNTSTPYRSKSIISPINNYRQQQFKLSSPLFSQSNQSTIISSPLNTTSQSKYIKSPLLIQKRSFFFFWSKPTKQLVQPNQFQQQQYQHHQQHSQQYYQNRLQQQQYQQYLQQQEQEQQSKTTTNRLKNIFNFLKPKKYQRNPNDPLDFHYRPEEVIDDKPLLIHRPWFPYVFYSCCFYIYFQWKKYWLFRNM